MQFHIHICTYYFYLMLATVELLSKIIIYLFIIHYSKYCKYKNNSSQIYVNAHMNKKKYQKTYPNQ